MNKCTKFDTKLPSNHRTKMKKNWAGFGLRCRVFLGSFGTEAAGLDLEIWS